MKPIKQIAGRRRAQKAAFMAAILATNSKVIEKVISDFSLAKASKAADSASSLQELVRSEIVAQRPELLVWLRQEAAKRGERLF